MKLYEANQTNEALSTGSFIHLLSSEMILFLHEILKFGVTDLGGRGLSNGGGSYCNLSYPMDSRVVLGILHCLGFA